jgi:hypothetical protein
VTKGVLACRTANTASDKGGGFYVQSGPVVFIDCTISGTSATVLGDGGAYYIPGSDGLLGGTIDDDIEQDV